MDFFFAIPLLLSAMCAYMDAKTYLIPNKVTIPLAVSGIIYSAFTGEIVVSLIGLAAGLLMFLIAFLSGGCGGGDLKLSAALGAWLGLGIVQVVLIACVIGTVWFCIIRRRTLFERIRTFFKNVYMLAYNCQMKMGSLNEDDPPEGIPFGVCLAAATWIFFALNITGVTTFVSVY